MKVMVRFLLLSLSLTNTHGFASTSRSGGRHLSVRTDMARNSELLNAQKDETDMIRAQIEEMRQEAIERLENLNRQVEDHRCTHDVPSVGALSNKAAVEESGTQTAFISESKNSNIKSQVEGTMALSDEQTRGQEHSHSSFNDNRDRLELLHGTYWKLAINIGREPGTWMPETWGVSGERLLLNLAVEFSEEQHYDREDFLNGMAGAKVLKVIDNRLSIGPSLTEGSRTLIAKNGGWRVASSEGAANTDLLRFYFEIEEVAKHNGCDVFCPKGRIYFTCGYFPMSPRRGSAKDAIRHEQEVLQKKYDRLSAENDEDQNAISIAKIKRTKEIFDIRMEAKNLGERMHEARIREPEKDLLRFSQDGNVALTREGGVCCKVPKGLAVEYHILGRFGVASLEKKDQSSEESRAADERPKLRP